VGAVGVCFAGIAPLSLELAFQLAQHGLVFFFFFFFGNEIEACNLVLLGKVIFLVVDPKTFEIDKFKKKYKIKK